MMAPFDGLGGLRRNASEGQPDSHINWTRSKYRSALTGSSSRSAFAAGAAKKAVHPKGRPQRIEPLEPRILLSADGILGAGVAMSAGDGLDTLFDTIDTLIDDDARFDVIIPGLRLADPVDDDNDNEGDRLAPEARDLLEYDFAQFFADPDNAPQELEDLDTDNDNVLRFDEIVTQLFTDPLQAFLDAFPETKLIPDGIDANPDPDTADTTLSDLVNGFTNEGETEETPGLQDFLDELLTDQIASGNASFFIADVSITSGGGAGSEFVTIDLTLKVEFAAFYDIDLGLTAEELEILLPDENQSTARIAGQISLPISFTLDRADGPDQFSFVATDDFTFEVLAGTRDAAGNYVPDSLDGLPVNVGFLGMEATTGSVFNLSVPITAEIIDPSSPHNIGFADGSFLADGDGVLTSTTGVLEATAALDATHAKDIIFTLQAGTTTSAFDVVIEGASTSEADIVNGVIADLPAALSSLITVNTNVDGELVISLVDTDATAFGFAGQNISDAGGVLEAANALTDFSTLDEVLDLGSFLLSFNGAEVALVTVAPLTLSAGTVTDRQQQLIDALQSVIDTALGSAGLAADVAVTINGDNEIVLTTTGGQSLEITRTLEMTAEWSITTDELTAPADELYLVEPRVDDGGTPENEGDFFSIDLVLNANAGLDVNGTYPGSSLSSLDGLTLSVTRDVFIPDGDDFEFITKTDLSEDPAGFARFSGDDLILDGNNFSNGEGAGDFQALLDFADISNSEVLNMLNQLKGWLNRLPVSDMFGDFGVPFTEGNFGDLFQFGNAVSEELLALNKLVETVVVDGSEFIAPTFTTVQELAGKLISFGVMNPGGLNYDLTARQLTYDITLQASTAKTVSVDFDLPLDPVLDVSVEADVGIDAGLTFAAQFGIQLGAGLPIEDTTLLTDLNNGRGVDFTEQLAVTGYEDVNRVIGRLSSDATFQVKIGSDDAVTVTVAAADTATNSSAADLVADIQAAIDATGPADLAGKIVVAEVAGRIVIQADPVAAIDTFSLIVSSTNGAFTELGLRSTVASTVAVTGADISDPSALSGPVDLTLSVNGGAGNSGNGGYDLVVFIADIAGNNTVNDIINDVNAALASAFDAAGRDQEIVAARAGNSIVLAAVDGSISVFSYSSAGNTSNTIGLNTTGSDVDTVAGVSYVANPIFEPGDLAAEKDGLQFGRLSATQTVNMTVQNVDGATTVVNFTVTEAETEALRGIYDPNGDLADLQSVIQDKIDAILGAGNIEVTAIGGNQLVFTVNSGDISGFSFDAGTMADQLGLAAGVTVEASLGATATKPAPFYFGPAEDATFDIKYFETGNLTEQTLSVSVTAGEAVNNRFIFDLVNDVNRAINAAFGPGDAPFIADFDGNRLVIRVADGAGIDSFAIEAATGDAAVDDLKLQDIVADVGMTQSVAADAADFLIFASNGEVLRVDLSGDPEALTFQDVKDAVADAVADAGLAPGAIVMGVDSLGISVQVEDTTGGSDTFRITTVNGSNAAFDLGLVSADLGGLATNDVGGDVNNLSIGTADGIIVGDTINRPDLADRLFLAEIGGTPIFQATVGIDVLIPSDDPATTAVIEGAVAKFGFVGVKLSSANPGGDRVEAAVSASIKDSLYFVLGDDPLSTDLNNDGAVDVFDAAEVFDFPSVSVTPGNDTLAFSVELIGDNIPDILLPPAALIELTVDSFGDPLNIPVGALNPFDSSAVDTLADTITIAGHGFETGNSVVYRSGAGDPIEFDSSTGTQALVDGKTYYIIKVDDNTIQLASSESKALGFPNATPAVGPSPIDLSGAGTGAEHRLQGFNPIAPDFSVTSSALEALEQFGDVDFDNILAALIQLKDLLLEVADVDFLETEIPILGVSFAELVDIAESFATAVDDIANNPPATLQELTQKITESFGLPPAMTPFQFLLVDDNDEGGPGGDGDTKDMLKIVFDLNKAFSEALDIDFKLTDSSGNPITVPLFGEISVLGNTGLGASGGFFADLVVGVDLDEDANDETGVDPDTFGEVFLFANETQISASLLATSADINFNASIGPLGASILGGDGIFDISFDLSNDTLPERVSFFDNSIGDIFAGFAATAMGAIDLTLPVYFPTQSDYIGDITFNAGLDLNGFTATPTVGFPDEFLSAEFFENFDIFTSIPLMIDAIDLLLTTLQDVATGDVFGVDLPFIGDALADAVEFIDDIRSDFIDPFITLFENTPKTGEELGELLQAFIFSLLGPGINPDGSVDKDAFIAQFPELAALASSVFPVLGEGLDLIDNVDFSELSGLGALSIEDFLMQYIPLDLIPDGNGGFEAIEWNFELSDTFSPSLNTQFDFGLPALGFEVDGGLGLEISYVFGLGFGVSLDDGAYINLDSRGGLPEIELTATAGFLEGSEVIGRLGILQFSALVPDDGIGPIEISDDGRIRASFSIDLVNKADPMDSTLSFFDFGNLDFMVNFDAEADLNLMLELGFNTDLLPGVIAGLAPSIEAGFLFEWTQAPIELLAGNFEIDFAGNLDTVKFYDIYLDLGSFIGEFLGGIVGQIQEITEPFQEIIDIITAPIPVLSDLAGQPISLVDIAAAFGEFDPGLIYALADLISFINSIPEYDPNDPAIRLLIAQEFVLFGSPFADPNDLADPTFKLADAISEGGSLFEDFSAAASGAIGALGGLLGDGGFDSSVFDGAFDSGGNAAAGETKELTEGILGGGFNSEQGGFSFPFLEDPTSILGLLLGRPVVFVAYDLAPLVVEFNWEQAFPIYPPLYGAIGAGVSIKIDLAFGYDSKGIQDFAEGGFENPLDLINGFYISDTANPDGSGADVPELQFTGEITVGAQLNAGIASAGVNAAIALIVDFDLNDPDADGRVRLGELAGNFLYELNYGEPFLAPVAIFDVSGEISFQLRAFIEILFVIDIEFEITPPITLFEFEIEFDREPILATERGDGAVLLNIGANSGSRLHGNTDDIGEIINVRQISEGEYEIWSDQLGVGEGSAQRYSGDRIVGFGGEFDDVITLDGVTAFEIFGESGNDAITVTNATSGGGVIDGGVGDDTLISSGGDDAITGGEGNDVIDGGAGADLIFGDLGRVSERLTTGSTNENDGDDIISGGTGMDTIFGGSGMDTIGGDATPDTAMPDAPGDGDLIFGDGGRIEYAVNMAGERINPEEILEIRSTEGFLDEADIILGHGGDDTVYGGRGDDSIDGGADDDFLYGETGFDTIEGAGGADVIDGGDNDDILYGYREDLGVGDEMTDGGDTITGGENNDFIRGNRGDDDIDGGRGADIIFGDENDDIIVGGSGLDYIFGGADNDSVEGGTGNDIVFGDDGLVVFFDFDLIPAAAFFESRAGNLVDADGNRLIGDAALPAGDPFVDDGRGNTLDLIFTVVAGTDGNDTVTGGEGDDIIIGGAGHDLIFGDFDPNNPPEGPLPADDDILFGDAGRVEFQQRLRDRILSVVGPIAGNDTLAGNGGQDILFGGGNDDMTGDGMDYLYGRHNPYTATPDETARIEGADNGAGDLDINDDDILIGDDGVIEYFFITEDTPSNPRSFSSVETIFTLFETDPVLTFGNDPSLTGGADVMFGSKGSDTMFGGFGGDDMSGDGAGDVGEDVMLGDNGRIDYRVEIDTAGGLFASGDGGLTAADDEINSIASRIEYIVTTDTSEATGGSDTMSGALANDIVIGGVAGDVLTGGDNDDLIIGDNGEVIYNAGGSDDLARPGLDFVRTIDFALGGDDTISGGGHKDIVIGGTGGDFIYGDDNLGADPNFTTTTTDANPDEDILIGDQGEVEFNDALDNPSSDLPPIVRIETTDTAESDGGSDFIEGNEGIDVILGGVDGDILRGNEGDDIILGDEGILRYDGSLLGVPASMAEMSVAGLAPPAFDDDPLSVDVIATKAFDLGGDDTIFGNANDDIAFGGTGSDTIIGDNDSASFMAPFSYDPLVEAGQDVLIGDQGRVTLFLDGATTFAGNLTRVESTDVSEDDGDGDYIEGNDGADILIGGVNGTDAINANDILHGEADLPGQVGTGGGDIILGDEGLLRFDAGDGELPGVVGTDNATLDQIVTFKTGMMSAVDRGDGLPALGGVDLIFGNDGDDIVMGGTDGDIVYGDLYANGADDLTNLVDGSAPGADILLGDGGEMFFESFEVFGGELAANEVTLLRTAEIGLDLGFTADDGFGGADRIEGNEGGDIILGGAKGDWLFGESELYLPLMNNETVGDVILGDNGELSWILASDVIDGRPDVSTVTLDGARNTLDRITTTNPTIGGADIIEGNAAGDTIFGGTSSDLIWGDTRDDADIDASLSNGDAGADGADGDDLVFGDHGKVYPSIDLSLPGNAAFLNNNFFSIDTQKNDQGNDDIIFGGDSDDIAIGGQGDDLIFGEIGDDDLIGGHNVANGDDEITDLLNPSRLALDPQILADLNPTFNKEFNDILDGGEGDDVIAGDNAIVIRQASNESPRFRVTDASINDGAVYKLTSQTLANLATVDVGFEANVTTAQQNHLDMDLVRTVYLLNHNEASQDDALNDTDGRRWFGNDLLTGGLNDDEIFGQLGDDVIQGDGKLIADALDLTLAPYNPAQNANPSFGARNVTIEMVDVALNFSIFEDAADGNDYIEGNGGSDRVYGGLGQDDIIGGSSSLFFFGPSMATDRPDGADLIYGATGNPDALARSATGGSAIVDANSDRSHALDADTILGDNGNIYQIVETDGSAAQFDYDISGRDPATGDSGYSVALPIRVHAVEFVDYKYEYIGGDANSAGTLTFSDTDSSSTRARGAGDLIFGETGDDIIHGMTGNDAIYGNAGDDDLYGEIGTDFLLGGTGRDGVLGDDGLLLTSRNNLAAEPYYGISALEPDEGPLKNNETPNLNSLNVVITTPGNIQIEIINIENRLTKAVELFAFRTDDVELVAPDVLNPGVNGVRFNDIIFGGLGIDFIHGGDGDDAISGAEALPEYYSGEGYGGLGNVNAFLERQQGTANVTNPDDPDFSEVNAQPFWFSIASSNPGDILRFGDRDQNEFALYDEFSPRRKIILEFEDDNMNGVVDIITEYGPGNTQAPAGSINFLLNFDKDEGPDDEIVDPNSYGVVQTDGDDVIFGDLGNDWLVGGTGRDHMYGGRGSDLLNMDDDHDSGAASPNNPNKGVNDQIENTLSDETQAYADIAYGGAGRDVLILNTGADRSIDWVGEFNSYIVPFSPFGAFHISRTLQPQLADYLEALSDSDGADVTATMDPTAGAGVLPSVVDAQLYVEQKLNDVRTDDPDPDRNFEPFGELGMVRQQDRDWGDQTGAPDDPQPGNFQGKREIMRRELFNDANSFLFADLTGDFQVQSGKFIATPDFVGDQAKSVFYLDATIGNYVEILVDATLEKDKKGFDSNGYIIFDYQSESDFKFAGINASTNKIQIGHYDAISGWVVDTQSNMLLRAGTNYELTLALHGTVATIIVDGANATTHAFSDTLRDGLVGLGTDNSIAAFDNYQVQKLPPIVTLTDVDAFSGASSLVANAGEWSVAGERLIGSYSTGAPAVSLKSFEVQPFSRIWIETTLNTTGSGGVVFDYSETSGAYKFAALDADNNQLVFGHVVKGSVSIDAAFAFDVVAGQDYDLKATLIGGSISIEIDGTDIGGHIFNSLINDGLVGAISLNGEASFDHVTLKTDDPAYAQAEPLTAASTATDPVGTDAILERDDLYKAVAAAKLYWLDSGHASRDQLDEITMDDFFIADLSGNFVGQAQANGMILIDGDAAGYGWSLGARQPGFDLTHVVAHEIGHVLGYDHGDEVFGEIGHSFTSAVEAAEVRPTVSAETGELRPQAMVFDSTLLSAETKGVSAGEAAAGAATANDPAGMGIAQSTLSDRIETYLFDSAAGELSHRALESANAERVWSRSAYINLLADEDDDGEPKEAFAQPRAALSIGDLLSGLGGGLGILDQG